LTWIKKEREITHLGDCRGAIFVGGLPLLQDVVELTFDVVGKPLDVVVCHFHNAIKSTVQAVERLPNSLAAKEAQEVVDIVPVPAPCSRVRIPHPTQMTVQAPVAGFFVSGEPTEIAELVSRPDRIGLLGQPEHALE
jgi:hypothetical protein